MTGLPDPQVAIHAVGMPADAALDREAVLLEDAGEVLRRLEFLKAELAEAEDLIDHLLRHHAPRLDVGDGFFLQRVECGGPAASAPWAAGARSHAPAERRDQRRGVT